VTITCAVAPLTRVANRYDRIVLIDFCGYFDAFGA
jgi:hypothetical protein